MGVVLTPVYTNSCQGANQNPADPTNIFEIGGGLPTNDVLQILNAKLTTTVEVQADGTASLVPNMPGDHYISVTLTDEMLATSALFLYVRGSDENLDDNYALDIAGPLNDDTGQSGYGITATNDNGSGTPFVWVDFAPMTFQAGDIIAFAAIGGASGSLYFIVNGVIIFQGALNLNPDGIYSGLKAGLQLATVAGTPSPTDIGVINLSAGGIAITGGGGDLIDGGIIPADTASGSNYENGGVLPTSDAP
jgi:hypothetical protein